MTIHSRTAANDAELVPALRFLLDQTVSRHQEAPR